MRTLLKFTILACLPAVALSTLGVYPHQLAYFNELSGGPLSGHEHLLGSSLDFGQDLPLVYEWMRANELEPADVRFQLGEIKYLRSLIRDPTPRSARIEAVSVNEVSRDESRWRGRMLDGEYERLGYTTWSFRGAPQRRGEVFR